MRPNGESGFLKLAIQSLKMARKYLDSSDFSECISECYDVVNNSIRYMYIHVGDDMEILLEHADLIDIAYKVYRLTGRVVMENIPVIIGLLEDKDKKTTNLVHAKLALHIAETAYASLHGFTELSAKHYEILLAKKLS